MASFSFVSSPHTPSVPIPEVVSSHPRFAYRSPLAYHAFGPEFLAKRGQAYYTHAPPVPGALPIPLPFDVEYVLRHFDMDVWYDPDTPAIVKTAVSAWARRVYATHDGYQMLLGCPQRPPMGTELAQLVLNFWEVLHGPGASAASALAGTAPPGFGPADAAPGDVSAEAAPYLVNMAIGHTEDDSANESDESCEVSFDAPAGGGVGEGVVSSNIERSEPAVNGSGAVVTNTTANAELEDEAAAMTPRAAFDTVDNVQDKKDSFKTVVNITVVPVDTSAGSPGDAPPTSPQTPETIIKTPEAEAEGLQLSPKAHDKSMEQAKAVAKVLSASRSPPKKLSNKKIKKAKKAAAEAAAAALVAENESRAGVESAADSVGTEGQSVDVAAKAVAAEVTADTATTPDLAVAPAAPLPLPEETHEDVSTVVALATDTEAPTDDAPTSGALTPYADLVDTNGLDKLTSPSAVADRTEAPAVDAGEPEPTPKAKTQKRNRNRRIQNKKKQQQKSADAEAITVDPAIAGTRIVHIPKHAKTSPRGYAIPLSEDSSTSKVVYLSARREHERMWQSQEIISQIAQRHLGGSGYSLVTPVVTDESVSTNSSVSGTSTTAAGAELDAIITGQLQSPAAANKTAIMLPIIPVSEIAGPQEPKSFGFDMEDRMRDLATTASRKALSHEPAVAAPPRPDHVHDHHQ